MTHTIPSSHLVFVRNNFATRTPNQLRFSCFHLFRRSSGTFLLPALSWRPPTTHRIHTYETSLLWQNRERHLTTFAHPCTAATGQATYQSTTIAQLTVRTWQLVARDATRIGGPAAYCAYILSRAFAYPFSCLKLWTLDFQKQGN